MNELITKACLSCGTNFTTTHSNQKYCQYNCITEFAKKGKYEFNIILFNLKENKMENIITSKKFINKYNQLGQLYSAESAIRFYYKENGFEVEDFTRECIAGHSDFIVTKRKNKYYVEVKNLNDSLRFIQLVFLFKKLKTNKSIIAYVVPKSYDINKIIGC